MRPGVWPEELPEREKFLRMFQGSEQDLVLVRFRYRRLGRWIG